MTSQRFELSRRNLMQAVGLGAGAVATTSVLGACQADSGDGGDGASGKFVYVYPFDVSVEHYNAALNTGVLLTAAPVAELFIPRCAILNWDTLEWTPQLAESVTLDATTLTIKLRSGIKWTDGNAVTAKDVVGTIYLQKLNAAQGTIGWDQLVSATADDDTTVTVTYSEAFTGVEHGALKAQVLPYARYGEWMDEAQGLVEAGEVQGGPGQVALAEKIAAEDFLDEDFISCGAYKFDQIGETVITLTVHEDGLFADQVKFSTIEVQKGDNAASVQFLLSSAVDYSTQVLGATDRSTIAGVEGLKEISTPGYDGIGLMLNEGRFPEFADAKVRKALMYVFDTEVIGEIAKGAGGYYIPSTYSGLPDPHAEGLFDDVELEYYTTDHAKAETLLTEAGWAKESDGWHKPDGSLAEYTIIGVEGWTDFSLTGEQAASQLTEFGLAVSYENVPADNPWGIWGAGDFDIAVRQWANPFVPYVYGSWQMTWFTDNSQTADQPGMGLNTAEVATTSLGTVNVDDLYLASQKGTEEEQAEANKTLGIVFNETLPRLPLFLNQRVSYAIEGERVKKIDAGDYALNDIYFDNPIMVRILEGGIEPV
ncbi:MULTISPECIES: ABC transporter substrate-binding protein [Glycomyces]|uniref:Peptide/nickel transport system substrate-binding protein n=1 Tax=Glycomyces artemisiae TaxID=1076443 RepID=A0A2T0UMI8_9ACTN|nr:ABC transporter substrate-binding protein [Glycomyces artemisiae]PRY59078.1 peptide/nickel transport system substrate-binding protein [Glycomyces artemisiae]